jgi:hypothetical protein
MWVDEGRRNQASKRADLAPGFSLDPPLDGLNPAIADGDINTCSPVWQIGIADD